MAESRTVEKDEAPPSHARHEIVGLTGVVVGFFLIASLLSRKFGGAGGTLVGPFGESLAELLLQAIGNSAFLVPLFVAAAGVSVFRTGFESITLPRFTAALIFVCGLSIFLGLIAEAGDELTPGGLLGGFLATVTRDNGGELGAYMIALALCVFSVLAFTGASLSSALQNFDSVVRQAIADARARRQQARVHAPIVANRPRAVTLNDDSPVILLDEVVSSKRERARRRESLPLALDGYYQVPSTDLLDEPPHDSGYIDEAALRRSADILEAKLANFGIQGKVVAVRPGPVITTFEIEPAPGVKVTRIINLQDDLTMALRALGVRIIAPIPGKAVVGIEVANASRETVYLRQIIDSEEFAASPSSVSLALGKDSVGHPVAADLAKMPHLLIAGATGTGKSVSLNAMIMSILMKATPRDVRFIMIDLKMLELSMYEELPHLLVPVVTDPKKAVIVLKNLVEEMDNRYRVLKEKRVRNIDGYNHLIDTGAIEEVIDLTQVVGEEGFDSDEEEDAKPIERMPRLVVIIDELADLMMSTNRQAEDPITRLAQKARACGIHLILATQRPSVDVITGLIKANFPARIAFQVTSRVDSRTILDNMGAERLLGQGDMLFMPAGPIRRLHGAFVSEEEIRRVTGFAKQQGRPDYAFELLESPEEEDSSGGDDDELADELYDLAVRHVTESRQASISWVQRKMRVGYNRAARMIERMERDGIVSVSDHGRPREVLAPPPPKD